MWTQLIRLCVQCEQSTTWKILRNHLLSEVNETTLAGSSPLHFVALGENIELAEWLLNNGAHILANNNGETPLHWACQAGHVPMVKLFLKAMTPTQIAHKDRFGDSALLWAIESKKFEVIELFTV